MSISRRKFLGWLGAAGMGTAMGKTARAASNKNFSGYPDSNGVLFDSTRCIGCRKCEEGCNQVNELPGPDKAFSDLSVLDTDRRTDSKAYGEHWSRHWLDIARYADTHGGAAIGFTEFPFSYTYRDYVIRSLNDDKSWSRFVQEQIAGDALFPGTPDGIVALG